MKQQGPICEYVKLLELERDAEMKLFFCQLVTFLPCLTKASRLSRKTHGSCVIFTMTRFLNQQNVNLIKQNIRMLNGHCWCSLYR